MNEPGNFQNRAALVEFFRTIGRLKHLPRTGWIDRGMPVVEVESVADHSFRVALFAWLLAADEQSLDRDRVLKLALIHDLAEAIVGDLTPYDARHLSNDPDERSAFLNQRQRPASERAANKKAAETAAFQQMTEALTEPVRSELRALWSELEERSTPESQFVKEVDRLETYLQSVEYLDTNPALPMDSFRLEVEETISTPSLIRLRRAIGSMPE